MLLPLKFMFLGYTMVTLRSETLLYMSTHHYPVLQRQRRPRAAGERGHARHHRLLRPDPAHDGRAALGSGCRGKDFRSVTQSPNG